MCVRCAHGLYHWYKASNTQVFMDTVYFGTTTQGGVACCCANVRLLRGRFVRDHLTLASRTRVHSYMSACGGGHDGLTSDSTSSTCGDDFDLRAQGSRRACQGCGPGIARDGRPRRARRLAGNRCYRPRPRSAALSPRQTTSARGAVMGLPRRAQHARTESSIGHASDNDVQHPDVPLCA